MSRSLGYANKFNVLKKPFWLAGCQECASLLAFWGAAGARYSLRSRVDFCFRSNSSCSSSSSGGSSWSFYLIRGDLTSDFIWDRAKVALSGNVAVKSICVRLIAIFFRVVSVKMMILNPAQHWNVNARKFRVKLKLWMWSFLKEIISGGSEKIHSI